MIYALYAAVVLVLIGCDQLLKAWTVSNLALGESAAFLPGLLQLTRVHNYGAAWSSFSGKTVMLIAVTAVLLAVKVHPTTYWQLIPPGLIFVAVYAVCMWLFGLNRYERSLVTGPLRRIFHR